MKISIISDVHINSYFSKWKKLLPLLESLETDLLILNGDIYDLLLGKPQFSIFDTILSNSKIKEFIYIPGNHDDNIKDYFPELLTQNSFEIGDIFVKHGHIDDLAKKFKSSSFLKWGCIIRDWLERIFKLNVRLLFKKVTFGLLDKILFRANIKAVNRYPNKKVIIGHTHLPTNKPPYFNGGCMTDDYFSYIEVTMENEVGTIKLISEKD